MKPKPKKKTQLDFMKSVRKPMPPPTTAHNDKRVKLRKKARKLDDRLENFRFGAY